MDQLKTPLVLAFGHKARRGKDWAARTIVRERGGDRKIVTIAFADALRKEVQDDCDELIATGMAHNQEDALAILCLAWDAEFLEDAPKDDTYPHGKQRPLLQAIGQRRREDDPDYWVKLWRRVVEKSDADVVIVTDMRYPNEMAMVKAINGHTVKFDRAGFAGLNEKEASHISETALDGAKFDHHVVVQDGDLPGLESSAVALYDHIITTRGL